MRVKTTCWTSLALAAALLLAAPGRAQSTPLPPGSVDPESSAPASNSQFSTPASGSQPSAALATAESKIEAKDYPGAIALLDPYLSAHSTDARALFDRGYVEDAQGHTASAESYYRKAIAADPQQFESRLALGLLLAAEGAPQAMEARTQLEAATHLTPQPPNPAAQAQAGRALARLLVRTDPEAARQALLGALKLSPETTADTLLTAEIAEAAGDPETAEQAYRGVLAATPATGDSDAALQATTGLAHLLIAAKKYPDAELLLRRALTRNATDPVLNTQLANVLAAEGKRDDAIAALENLHAAHPESRGVSAMLADLYTQAGQPAQADPLYVELLAAQPVSPDPALLAARGDNLIQQKRFAEAVTILQQATQLNSQDGAAWSSLAFAASVNHQPQLTLDALAMRSKVMDETPATYFLAATSYDSLHQTKRAVEMYRQFLAVAGGKFPDEEWQAKHRLAALPR